MSTRVSASLLDGIQSSHSRQCRRLTLLLRPSIDRRWFDARLLCYLRQFHLCLWLGHLVDCDG